MEYVVIKDLIERKTLKQFKAGDIYPCFDPARADFLIEKGYILPKEEQPKESVEEKPEKEAKPQKATTKRSTSSTKKKKA